MKEEYSMKEQRHFPNGIIVTKQETNNFAGEVAYSYKLDSLVYKSNFRDKSYFFSDPLLQRIRIDILRYFFKRLFFVVIKF